MSIVKVRNIFLVGPMGAGKSTIGRALAKEMKLEFYDTDEVIELRAGANIAWIFDIEGLGGYRNREMKDYSILAHTTTCIVFSKPNCKILVAMIFSNRSSSISSMAIVRA